MPLNADTVEKPGRLPATEAVSLTALLKGNRFNDTHCTKARSDTAHAADLDQRFARVLAVEAEFQPGDSTAKRIQLRRKLLGEYDPLLAAAAQYRDAATTAHDAALTAAVKKIRDANPTAKQLYTGNGPWKDGAREAITKDTIGVRLMKLTTVDEFRAEVYKRYNAKPAPVPQFTPQEKAALQAEKNGVNTQHGLWTTVLFGAPGCNDIGTWGTSKGGVGGNYAVTTLSARLWAELEKWWLSYAGAYVAPSLTATWSLKMSRVSANLSPMFNYHVNVG